jgi:hypothetical protein
MLVLRSVPAATPPEATDGPTTADAQGLIASLARPAPSVIDFAEIRFSPLLREALIVSGVLGYSGLQSLDRRIVKPYREDTEIRGNAVRVRREGEPERSFALTRAPELQALLNAFTSLLAGDHANVERNFQVTVTGNTELWRMSLVPRDARLARRIKQIRIDGRSDLPQCFSILNDKDSASVMLLGAAAQVELPQPLTLEWLERKCAALASD